MALMSLSDLGKRGSKFLPRERQILKEFNNIYCEQKSVSPLINCYHYCTMLLPEYRQRNCGCKDEYLQRYHNDVDVGEGGR